MTKKLCLGTIAGIAREDGAPTDHPFPWTLVVLRVYADGYEFAHGEVCKTEREAKKVAKSKARPLAAGYRSGPIDVPDEGWPTLDAAALAGVTFADGRRCGAWYVAVAGVDLFRARMRLALVEAVS